MERQSPTSSRRIRRNRTIYSCHACRRRKVKCDKIQPMCGNCQRSGDNCTFSESAISPTSIYANNPTTRSCSPCQDDNPTSKKKRASPSADGNVPAPTVGIDARYRSVSDSRRSSVSKEELELRLNKLTAMVESMSRQKIPDLSNQGCSRSDLDSVEEPEQQQLPFDLDDLGTLGSVGHLSLQDNSRTRYVGSTYWAFVTDELDELNCLLKDDARRRDRSLSTNVGVYSSNGTMDSNTIEPRERSTLLRTGVPSNMVVDEEEYYDELPSKSQCDMLYRSFIASVHSVFALLHPPTLLEWYEEFFSWYKTRKSSQTPCPRPSFVPLLYAILHGGALSCPSSLIEAKFHGRSKSILASRFNDKVIWCLTAQSLLLSPTLPGLVAYLIVQTMAFKEEGALISNLSFSLALQLCESLGLHREPSNFGILAAEAEMRRRVWYHVVWLDTLLFTTNGWPPLVFSEDYWDVYPVTELRDGLIGTVEGIEYSHAVKTGGLEPDSCDDPIRGGSSARVNPSHMLIAGKYHIATALRSCSKILVGTQPIGSKEFSWCAGILRDVEEELEDLIDRMPDPYASIVPGAAARSGAPGEGDSFGEWYRSMPTENIEPEELEMLRSAWVALHSFVRTWLKMLVDKMYCLLHKPFLRISNRSIWTKIRNTVVSRANGYLEDFSSLATTSEYRPFQWAWPVAHQPLHAMTIILVDLYDHPLSTEAPASRLLIDRIFALTPLNCDIAGGNDDTHSPSEEGKGAWRLLRNLRNKAWRKAGLDPAYLSSQIKGCKSNILPSQSSVAIPTPEQAWNPSHYLAVDNQMKYEYRSASAPISSQPQQHFHQHQYPHHMVNSNTQMYSPLTPSASATSLSSSGHQIDPQDFDESKFDWEQWDAVFVGFQGLSEDIGQGFTTRPTL